MGSRLRGREQVDMAAHLTRCAPTAPAKHPDHPAIAVGRAMNKLLRLVFAVRKSGKPCDPNHYPWQKPAQRTSPATASSAAADTDAAEPKEQAAGHTPETEPDQQVVTAACSSSCAAPQAETGTGTAAPTTSAARSSDMDMSPNADDAIVSGWVDFAHLRQQLPLQRVLEQLALWPRLRGQQRRGPCPVHDSSGERRTFSVHLDKNVFQCFDPTCGIKGDIIDLWAAVKNLPLRAAALDLVHTFHLEPAPQRQRTEKRHG